MGLHEYAQQQMFQHECISTPAIILGYVRVLSNSEVSRNLNLKGTNAVIIKLGVIN